MHALLKSTCETPLSTEQALRLAEQGNPVLSRECRRRLRYMHLQSFDWEQGGLRSPIKFVDRDSVEYALSAATKQDQNEARMACLTLDRAMALLDPVWGGIYQYSTQGRWDLPHYRKTMAAQAGHLRLYSLAYAHTRFDRYLEVADAIQAYVKNFLTTDSGAFYSGQSDNIAGMNPRLYFALDHSKRRLFGIPEIDRRIHSRENGWIIEALATHYEYCGNRQSLEMAVNAAEWINRHYRNGSNGYSTNNMTTVSINLADTLAMARAMLQLYRATFKSKYLRYASAAALFMNKHFKNAICGYNSRLKNKNESSAPRQVDENIALTRFFNLLFHYTNETKFKKMARHGFRYLIIPEVATARMEEAGILLIDHEISSAPLTINITGNSEQPVFNALISSAHRRFNWYKLIKVHEAATVSATVEIDGIKSKPVNTPCALARLLTKSAVS